MNYIDFHIRHIKFQYIVLTVMLVLILLLSRWPGLANDMVVEEGHANAEVISITSPDIAGNHEGLPITVATVLLETGERSNISLPGSTLEAGDLIEVRTITYESGKTRILASDGF